MTSQSTSQFAVRSTFEKTNIWYTILGAQIRRGEDSARELEF